MLFRSNILNSDSHLPTSMFLDLMYSYFYVPLINKPTRIRENSATVIDNIYKNCAVDNDLLTGIFFVDITDHFPIFAVCKNVNIAEKPDDFIYKRSFSERNIANFNEKTSQIDYWTAKIMNINDCQLAFTEFQKIISGCVYNECFPVRKMKIGYKTKKMWLTPGLKKSIHMKNMLYIKSCQFASEYNITLYKSYKSKLDNILRRTERQHYQELF